MDNYRKIKQIDSLKPFGIIGIYRRIDDNEVFAIKEIKNKSREAIQEMEKEVMAIKKIRSPFVVKCYDFFSENSNFYLALTYCPLGTLEEFLDKSNKKLEEDKIWKLFIKIALGLGAIHKSKLIHKDLKPENIFLLDETEPKIGEFRISKEQDPEESMATTSVKTPYYLAPEVINDQIYDEKTDIWSLGCILFKMCTLKVPFKSYRDILTEVPDNIPDSYSKELQNLVEELLDKNPDNRPSVSKILDKEFIFEKLAELNLEKFANRILPKKFLQYIDSVVPLSQNETVIECFCYIDSKSFATCDLDGNIKIWDINTCECLKAFKANTSVFYISKLSENYLISGGGVYFKSKSSAVSNKSLLFSGNNCEIKIWNLKTGKSEDIKSQHKSWVNKICELSDKKLCTASNDGTLEIFEKAEDKLSYEHYTILEHSSNYQVYSFIELKSNGYILSYCSDHTTKLWNKEYECRKTIEINLQTAGHQCFLEANNGEIIVASLNCLLILDIEEECIKDKIEIGEKAQISCVIELDPEGIVLCGGSTGLLYEINLNKKKLISKKKNSENSKENDGFACLLAFNPEVLITSSHDKKTKIWKIKD